MSTTSTAHRRLHQLTTALENHEHHQIWYVIARKNPHNSKERFAYQPFKDHGIVFGGCLSGLPSMLNMQSWNYNNVTPEQFTHEVKHGIKNLGHSTGSTPRQWKQFYKDMKPNDVMFVADPLNDRFLLGLLGEGGVKFTSQLRFQGKTCADNNMIHYRDCEWVAECTFTDLGKGTTGRKPSLPAQTCRAAMMASPSTIGRIFLPPGSGKFNTAKNFPNPHYWRKELVRMVHSSDTTLLDKVGVDSRVQNEQSDVLRDVLFVPKRRPVAKNAGGGSGRNERMLRRSGRNGGSGSGSGGGGGGGGTRSSHRVRRSTNKVGGTATNTARSTKSASRSKKNVNSRKGRKVKVRYRVQGSKEWVWFYGVTYDVLRSGGEKVRVHWDESKSSTVEKQEHVRTVTEQEWRQRSTGRNGEAEESNGEDDAVAQVNMSAYELAREQRIKENKMELNRLEKERRQEKRKRTAHVSKGTRTDGSSSSSSSSKRPRTELDVP